MKSATTPLPEWAEEWVRGKCGCGARLCRPFCYCGGHIVCSASGWEPDKCDLLSRGAKVSDRD